MCQQLAASQNPQIQAWAQEAMVFLSAKSESTPEKETTPQKPTLTPEQAAQLLQSIQKIYLNRSYTKAC
ncbi:hypothetical protein [Fischerella sp. PCC 9605]|uniref:hypothetical protein n=1 Tax=Fischerella sp. PCC 9605 TaxID=1173024 RepID=UPI0004798048|nr:hypothetical protein [Fischerella sp. PCC 9605]